MRFKIIADSCTDPVPGLRSAPEYQMVPLLIHVGGREFVDDGSIVQEDLIRRMAASAEGTKTSCPPPQWYVEAFEGADEVYVITLSAALSGSYNSAMQARAMYLEEHPEKKVHVFNSHSACAGQSALLVKLFALCRAELPFERVIEEMDHFIAHLTTLFVLENLDNLRKNGRLTEIQALITGTLHLKLLMEGTPAGTINKIGQSIAMRQGLMKLADAAAARAEKHGIEGRTLVISHCNCPERAKFVRSLLLKKTPFTDAMVLNTGGLSTVYAGDGGVVVAF